MQEIAHRPCVVPNQTAQRLILLLHAARSVHASSADIRAAWGDASDLQRERIRVLAHEVDAEVALAAATGELDRYRDRPEYDLWRLYVDGTATTTGFRRIAAEIKAAPDDARFVRLRVAWYAISALVQMPRRLASEIARTPTFSEIAAAYLQYFRRAADLLVRRRRPSGDSL